MRSKKGSHRIVVDGVEYRWRATGNDGWISIGIWPANNVGSYIRGSFGYHETWLPGGKGTWHSARDQIVITSRLIERVIRYAKTARDYDPHAKGPMLSLHQPEELIQWDDAVRPSQ